ncbi:uncharacterized protein LOC110455455 [Mizuhopecten yessoensis]|uniref:Uncharacterized protein n=1 Tax=Mizuhopecten yessoensis TaxID=6573 RepID=A0A210R417_MIZYE|nr:uncharacterized protein LOC110455455 [Mizuhopecten yessoensis]XP_021361283.1 uncharacterized protein LOC110455455 [Mizuhopecten yessoensis]OWF55810.1 hypothetical protein KP79_PYT10851 [Mizuhopecten yessoensis]
MAKRYQPDIVGDDELAYDNELQPHLGRLQFDNEGFTPFDFNDPESTDNIPQSVKENVGSEVKIDQDQGQTVTPTTQQNGGTINEPSVTILTPNQNGNAQSENTPVHFNRSSESTIKSKSSEPRVNGGHGKDHRVIQTASLQEAQRWRDLERQRPLRQRHILLLKVFGIIACVFFFPTGIPAVYYAFKTEKEFDEGIMRGNIDEAQRCARKSERFIIFSGLLAILTAVIVFAVVERSLMDEQAYWDSHSSSRVLPP